MQMGKITPFSFSIYTWSQTRNSSLDSQSLVSAWMGEKEADLPSLCSHAASYPVKALNLLHM